jgi:4'-phosphopantetheinyl transferase
MKINAPTQIRVALTAEIHAAAPRDPKNWLSASEWVRFERLNARQPLSNRAQQYLSGHWLARLLLSAQFGAAPEHCQLEERLNLPPLVIAPYAETAQGIGIGTGQIALSISHSGGWIACAISDAAIGIDIEQRQPRDGLLRFQELLLAVGETPNSLSLDELLQRWVAKEAWIKRHHGSALPEGLAAIELHPAGATTGNVTVVSTDGFHLAMTAESASAPVIVVPGAVLNQRYFQCRPQAGIQSAGLPSAPGWLPG